MEGGSKMNVFGKKLLGIILTILIVITSTANTSAASSQSPLGDDFDRKMLADIIMEITYINGLLEPLDLSLGDFLSFPEVDESFYEGMEEIEEYPLTNGQALQLATAPFSRNASTREEASVFGNRYSYAVYIAGENMKRDRYATDLESETVYMYLSHFIDLSQLPGPNSPVDQNSNDGSFSAWITNDDRIAYEIYLNKVANGAMANDMRKSTTALISLMNTGSGAVAKDTLENVGKKINGAQDILATYRDGKTLMQSTVNLVKNKMTEAHSARELIDMVTESLALEDYDDEMSYFAANTVVSIGASLAGGGLAGLPASAGLFSVNTVTMVYKDFYDYACWVSLSIYRQSRIALRFMRYMGMS